MVATPPSSRRTKAQMTAFPLRHLMRTARYPFADLAKRFGNESAAQRAQGNLNKPIALRSKVLSPSNKHT
jgi:hypothetical protein